MSLRKEDAFQHVLCMSLSESSLEVSAIKRDTKSISFHQSLTFEDFNRDAVQAAMTIPELTYDYEAFCATAGGFRNTLIPVDLFNHAKPEDVFKLNYPAPIDNLDYNRIPELGIVNIYELPLWMKSLFVIKFPRVKIIHPVTVMLKGVFDQPTFSPKIHIHIDDNSFYLLITAKTKLQYFNRFDFTNLADLVYHVLFVLEQKEMDQKKMDVCLYGVNSKWEQLSELQGFFANRIKISDKPEMSDRFLQSKQLLCV
jgi:Protein of unknown function (DUF3822)